ncbi:MAG: hypothetical protein LBS01_08650 [Prevotellaceae bacterium]|jgi:hypothetical protein|nr:hypothetical protein [Prevotellaceae bacterium]
MTKDRKREGEIIKKIAEEFFSKFDCTELIGDIDFAVRLKRQKPDIDFADEYLLWAEAKQKSADIISMLAQLVLTIGKSKTFNKHLPPAFLGCFDSEKIAFISYHEIQDIFYQNDFNWNVAPSNHDTKEFKQVHAQIKKIVENDVPWQTFLFYFEKDEKELHKFIRENFVVGKSDISQIQIDKNNFLIIYDKWLKTVKPTIAANWDMVKKSGLIDGDFYLADLLSADNQTIVEKLFVLLRSNHYIANRHINDLGLFTESSVYFNDNQKAYSQFWTKYKRPPHEDYWDYMLDRHDLLVPQDIRERKGSFYTPRIWVEKSQEYLAAVFGMDWQDEYYVWDCCAGTGNLLAGLTNKDNIFASTLDKSDVDIMHERIKNGANLWEKQTFQFDFLNDEFLPVSKGGKLPEELYQIITDEKKRKKLVIYINPPYAEAASARTITRTGENRAGVSINRTKKKYLNLIGSATNELFALFLIRIYKEIPDCKIGQFSTQKILNAPNFKKFREIFLAKLEKCFVAPANTFDNVKGQFPIGFKIWNTEKKEHFKKTIVEVFDENCKAIGAKTYFDGINIQYINDWYRQYYDNKDRTKSIAIMNTRGNDFQNQNYIRISSDDNYNHTNLITIKNIIPSCIYFTVRKAIALTWLNDRDQFLYPNKKWEKDIEFQNDCLTFTLFNTNISTRYGVNHWIPFTEKEVNSSYKFESHFMTSFISGKIKANGYINLFENNAEKYCIKRELSPEAQAVFEAGRELWKYYHSQKNINVNASLYDIKEYFQGRNPKGKMNSKSADETYNELIGILREKLNILAQKIEPKVYEYEFLMK